MADIKNICGPGSRLGLRLKQGISDRKAVTGPGETITTGTVGGFLLGRKNRQIADGFLLYALAKSREQSELTTYRVADTQKSHTEDDLPVYGHRRTRCRQKIFHVS